MKFILGTKEYMSQVFDESGTVHPVTVVSAGPITVTQMKTQEKEGYSALQIGYGTKKKLNKPLTGHLKELGKFRTLREIRVRDDKNTLADAAVGKAYDLTQFAEGDVVHVVGTSKGKGFASVIKRHDFKGQPRSHGQKHSEHAPGSLGGGGGREGGRVAKGKRMAGRMGADRITVRNLKVIKVDQENGKLYIGGAVPGRRGTLLEIRSK